LDPLWSMEPILYSRVTPSTMSRKYVLNGEGSKRVVFVDVHSERIKSHDEFPGRGAVSCFRALRLGGFHLSAGGGDIESPVDEAGDADAGASARHLDGDRGPLVPVVFGPRLHQIDHRVRAGDADDRSRGSPLGRTDVTALRAQTRDRGRDQNGCHCRHAARCGHEPGLQRSSRA
jgi:hypothetical protein